MGVYCVCLNTYGQRPGPGPGGLSSQHPTPIPTIQLPPTKSSLFSYAAHMAKTYAMQITRSLGVVVMRYLNILFGASFCVHRFRGVL